LTPGATLVAKRRFCRKCTTLQDGCSNPSAVARNGAELNGLASTATPRKVSGKASRPYAVTKANGQFFSVSKAASSSTGWPLRLTSTRAASYLPSSTSVLERFPLFVTRGDSVHAANKILWPSP